MHGDRTVTDAPRPKLLLVDDQVNNLIALESLLLEDLDVDVVTARSGREALAAILRAKFALVLLDVQMPEMDGIETATLIRMNPATSRLPIIFVTAIDRGDAFVFKGYEAGAVDYLFKPVNPFILKSKVNVFLELYRRHHEVERLVAERTAELHEAKRQAELANRSKSNFLANVSHELRTPLSAIIGFSEILLRERISPGADEIALIHSAARQLLSLVNDVLDLSKIEAGKVELAISSFSIEELLRTSAKTVEPLMATDPDEPARSSRLKLAATAGTLTSDRTKIQQCLLNLLGNAAKFSTGDIWLRARATTTAAGDEWIELSVTDQGEGLTEEEIARVFRPFEQAELTSPVAHGGTGLGLTISRELCRMLGGDLTVASEPGRGATFTMRLPRRYHQCECCTNIEHRDVRPDTSPRMVTIPATPPKGSRNLKVLVAEDNAVNQKLIRRQLDKLGHVATVVGDGRAALDALEHGTFDIVLMDVQMPTLNGMDATLRIRERERATGGHVPIIALTAHAMSDFHERCTDVGMDDYLSKPLQLDQLARTIERYTSPVPSESEQGRST